MSWSNARQVRQVRQVRLRALFARRDLTGRPDLPMLSVYRDYGVVPREGRDDNYNKPGEHLGAYRVVQRGDLVLNKMKTWQGSLGISDYQGIVSPAYFVARPLTDDNPDFLHHLLRSRPLIAEYGARSKGIRPSQWDLPWEEFQNITVELPSPATQRAIADYLDRETARIDALITAKRRMVALLDEALISRYEMSLCNAAASRLPLRRLLTTPPQYGASESGYEGRSDWPRYIRITDLAADGSLRDADQRTLPPNVAQPYLLHDWDILIARSGATVGKAFAYRKSMGSCCFAGYLIRFRFDGDKLLPGLVELWTRTRDYWSQVSEAALQATIENVSAEKYKDLSVPVPPSADQGRLLAMLRSHRNRTERLQSQLREQMDLLTERRQALITAAVTGELDIPAAA